MADVQPSGRYRRSDILNALVIAFALAGLGFVLMAISAIVWPGNDSPVGPPEPRPAVTADRCALDGCDI